MAREAKFNFLPAENISRNRNTEVCTASITKSKSLYFPKLTIETHGLENKYMRLFVDEHKGAIGWKVMTEGEGLESMKGIRKLTLNSKSGAGTIMISKLIDALDVDVSDRDKMNGIPIQSYTDILMGVINYIKLK